MPDHGCVETGDEIIVCFHNERDLSWSQWTRMPNGMLSRVVKCEFCHTTWSEAINSQW